MEGKMKSSKLWYKVNLIANWALIIISCIFIVYIAFLTIVL